MVEGLYMYSRCLNHSSLSATATNVLIIPNVHKVTGFIVSGLQAFTKYAFFLIPFYKNIDGRPSNLKIVQTLEDGEYLPRHTYMYVVHIPIYLLVTTAN